MTEFEFLDSEDKQLIAKYLSKLDFVLSVDYEKHYIVRVRVDTVDSKDFYCDMVQAVGRELKERYHFGPALEFSIATKNEKYLECENLFMRGKVTHDWVSFSNVKFGIPENAEIFTDGQSPLKLGITSIDV